MRLTIERALVTLGLVLVLGCSSDTTAKADATTQDGSGSTETTDQDTSVTTEPVDTHVADSATAVPPDSESDSADTHGDEIGEDGTADTTVTEVQDDVPSDATPSAPERPTLAIASGGQASSTGFRLRLAIGTPVAVQARSQDHQLVLIPIGPR